MDSLLSVLLNIKNHDVLEYPLTIDNIKAVMLVSMDDFYCILGFKAKPSFHVYIKLNKQKHRTWNVKYEEKN